MSSKDILAFVGALLIISAFSGTVMGALGSSGPSGTIFVPEDSFLDLDGSDIMNGNLRLNGFNISGVTWLKGPLNLEKPSISQGLSPSGTGFKHVRHTMTVAASSTENSNLTWSGNPFPDSNYTASCNVEGTDTELDDINFKGVSGRYPSKIEVRVENTLVNSREVLIHCVGIHD